MEANTVVTLTDVPDSDVDLVIADFESEGAKVKRQRQADGKWTLIATVGSTANSSAKQSAAW